VHGCAVTWASASCENVSRGTGPPRRAQLAGLTWRGCLVLMLVATTERWNLLCWSDLGLSWLPPLGLLRIARHSNIFTSRTARGDAQEVMVRHVCEQHDRERI